MIGVHVRTLWNAARVGRLKVTHDTRTTFRQIRSLATIADAEQFKASYYRRRVLPPSRPLQFKWSDIPNDYDIRIRKLRYQLGLSQSEMAAKVGAARKAVVYQWESRKRCPSPVFWDRLQKLTLHASSSVGGSLSF
jgi:ribosome-binding protein aMBF1 (putative translation factor)